MKTNSKLKKKNGLIFKVLFILSGITATIWFLIRVVPKPSRAYYPCQRAAFPIMTGFVIWILGITSGITIIKKIKSLLSRKKFIRAAAYLFVFSILSLVLFVSIPPTSSLALLAQKNELPEPIERYSNLSATSIEPEATVGIIRSDRASAFDITKDEIETMVFDAIEQAGGLESLITNGDTVVIKPNLVIDNFNGKPLGIECNGMTTDWRVVAAVAKKVRQLNPNGAIIIMSGSTSKSALASLNYTKITIPEADQFLALENICGDWLDYSSAKLKKIVLPDGKALYPSELCPNCENVYYLNKIYYNADVLISIPVLKNHESAGVTGAIKNVGIGATPPNIYCRTNGNALRDIISHMATNLHYWIHDFYMARPVDFAVMDGLQGYNNGPVNSNRSSGIAVHQENMRLIAASKDPVAMDAIAALLMGDDPAKIGYLVHLNNDELGCSNPLAIKVRGAQVGELKKDFPHVSSDAKSDDYTDFTPPSAQLVNIETVGNMLRISLETDESTAKIDIEVGDNVYNPIITSGFNQFEVENIISDGSSIPKITLHVQDKYLNTTTISNWATHSNTITQPEILKVYPTIVNDFLTIEMNNDDKCTICIYSMIGQLISTRTSKGTPKILINCTQLPQGTYLGTVENNNGISPFRFIKP